MSAVTDFAKAMHTQAAALIGQENVVIGETVVPCTLAEVSDGRTFSNTGNEVELALTAVCLTSLLPASIQNVLVTLSGTTPLATRYAGKSFRIRTPRIGGTFTTLNLEEPTRA